MSVGGYDPLAGGGGGGSNGGVLPAKGKYGPNAAAILAQDPEQAYRAMLAQQGRKYVPRGLYSKFNESMFGNALSAYIMSRTNGAKEGDPGLDNINGILSDFGNALYGGGGNFYATMRNAATQGASGIDLSTLEADQADQLIKQLIGLKTMGYNKFAQSSAKNRYQDTMSDYGADILANNNGEDTADYGDIIKRSQFWQSLFGGQ
ncbi:MAG TPA: hypothetical protein VIL85_03630 [Thermomicrobiales bacterium]|jgi:hypothetical protein